MDSLLDEPGDLPPGSRFLEGGLSEALFAFAIFAPLLFVPQLGSLAPALSFGVTLIYAAARWGGLGSAMLRCWPLLVVPFYALFSALWSAYPGLTIKHALELFLTIGGGLALSASPRPAGVLAGAWIAFAAFMVASLLLGKSVDVGSMAGGQTASAFAGLNGVKNLFGMTAALAVLTSLFMLSRSISRRAWLTVLCAAALLLVELYLAFIARSAGALIAMVVSVGAFLVVVSLGPLRPTGRAVACAMLALLGTAVAVLGYSFANSAAAGTLNLFHKDPTLTGRSYLWYRAADFIGEHPVLGRGFEAFWVQGNVDAEGLWQYGQVAGQAGFNFHNTIIEFLVHFGWLGTILILGIFAVAALNLVARAIRSPSAAGAFYVSFVVFEMVRAPFESLMPSSVDFATVLMFAALGFGFQRAVPGTRVPGAAPALVGYTSQYPVR